MLAELKRGIQTLSAGVIGPFRGNQDGSLVVAPSLLEAALEGRLFRVANQAGVATTAALATTWTGLCVSNPSTSGKNAILHEFGWAQTVAGSADGAIGLMLATIAAPASNITIQGGKMGGTGSVMIADDGATLVSPALIGVYGSLGTLEVTGYGSLPPNVIDAKGKIIIPPGYTLATYSTKATTASLIHHFVWEERPV